MKFKKIIYISLFSLMLFACKDTVETNEPPPVEDPVPHQITGLQATAYDAQVLLKWTPTTDMDIDYYRVIVTGGDHPNPPVVVDATTRWITGLTNDVLYTFQVTAFDLKGQEGPLSATVNARPRSGNSDVQESLDSLNSGAYNDVITLVTASLNDNSGNVLSDASKNKLHNIIAWAYERLGDGTNSDQNYRDALDHFKLSSEDDSYVGRAVLGYMLGDFTASIQGADFIKSKAKYVTKFATVSAIYTYKAVLISGALSAYLTNNYAKCAGYLDNVEVVKKHSSDPDELYADLLRITVEFQHAKLKERFIQFKNKKGI
ncbi:MAG: fibronectin type III domain-containing protein [Calditrichaeota bacterium]|nr:fibronectin type III domain-containing protein [Calditrichota bacterium]